MLTLPSDKRCFVHPGHQSAVAPAAREEAAAHQRAKEAEVREHPTFQQIFFCTLVISLRLCQRPRRRLPCASAARGPGRVPTLQLSCTVLQCVSPQF